MKKYLFLLVILSFFGALALAPVLAFDNEDIGGNKEEIEQLNQEIQNKKDKIKQLEESINEYKKQIQQKRLEAVSLSNQVAILDNRLAQVKLDIDITQEKMDTLQLEIEELGLSIQDKQQVLSRQKEMLSELIRTLHYENNKKYIEVLAAYEHFSDFYNRVQYLKKIEKDMGNTARSVRLLKEDLEDKKIATEERKKSYEELKEKLENRKKDLEEQTQYKSILLAQTHASELTFNTLLNNLKSQYKQVENEITSIEQEVRRKLESQDKFSGEPTDGPAPLSWPTQSRYITAYFYDKEYPYRNIFEHNAIDIRASHGTAVKAAASGYIARAKRCSLASCYAYVMIVHSGGFSTVYGHLSGISVEEDQFVTRGDIIGYSGATPGTVGAGPFTTGPHLHFEVRQNGIPVNPLNYLIRDW